MIDRELDVIRHPNPERLLEVFEWEPITDAHRRCNARDASPTFGWAHSRFAVPNEVFDASEEQRHQSPRSKAAVCEASHSEKGKHTHSVTDESA